jgi:RNA polymerase sigma factor (TIGR02999 family)
MDARGVTQALARLEDGDAAALPELIGLLYHDLHRIAERELRRERRGHTLGPTALVNEAYLRLSRDAHINAPSRTRFLAAACVSMRRVLLDYARTRKRLKRGGGEAPLPLDESAVADLMSEREADEILALEDALGRLAAADERAARVVELRFFGGLSMEEIAQVLDVSSKTVQRTWLAARAWLRKEIGQELA